MASRNPSFLNGRKQEVKTTTCPLHKHERAQYPRINRSTSETPSYSSSSSSRPAFTTSTKVPMKPGEYNVSRGPSGRSIPMSEQSHSSEVNGSPWFDGNRDTRSLLSNRAPKTGYINGKIGTQPVIDPTTRRIPATAESINGRSRITKDQPPPKPTLLLKEITADGKAIESKQNESAQDFYKIKEKCLKDGTLFEDPEFPAKDSSLFFSKQGNQKVIWKRPTELSKNPKFFSDGASRFDVKQGELGNCWFLAAVANLTLHESIFYFVVPRDNSFDTDYCGVAHFRFWQFGKWVDICVDDYLPCHPDTGKLRYMHSSDPDEFWGPLVEKAYAKLNGSYEALKGGNSNEALQDFCGGIVEKYEIKEYKDDIFKLMETSLAKQAFMCCSIKSHPTITENVGSDGLVQGHAYSITGIRRVESKSPSGRKTTVKLIRIRNPWGNDAEWKGAWGDNSKEWKTVSEDVKAEMEVVAQDDGEFYMSDADFKVKFDHLEICNKSPAMFKGQVIEGRKWTETDYDGAWISGATAGGCPNYIYSNPKSYASNPQYIIEFTSVDENGDGDPDKCSFLIGLVQKNRRAKRKEGASFLSIGFHIYEITEPDKITSPLTLDFFKYNRAVASSGTYTNARVVNSRFEMKPGTYCIVPSTFEPNKDGEFLLRVFSESANTLKENGGDLGYADVDDKVKRATKEESAATKEILEIFQKAAGNEQELGWAQLKKVLDSFLRKEFEFDGFSREVCRSMIATMDEDRSGKLGLQEFTTLWTNILLWKNAFKKYDADKSGNLDSFELRKALQSAGLRINYKVLQALVMRYGDDNGSISFEDFVMSAIKLKAIIDFYKSQDIEGKDKVTFSLEEWVDRMIYS